MTGASGSRSRFGSNRVWMDSWPVALAVSVFAAALHPVEIPLWLAGSLMVVAVLMTRPWPALIGAAVLSSALASQAHIGCRSLSPGPFNGIVQLATDPALEDGRVSVDVRTQMGRFRLGAEVSEASAISNASAGDRFIVRGRIGSLQYPMLWRHLRGALSVDRVEAALDPAPAVALINRIRAVVERGAVPLPAALRPIHLGLVLGDDRGTSPVLRNDFEQAGLSHLMVVSGENLGFLLVLIGPVLRRAGLRRRFLSVTVMLALFVAVTRFEPSVLRASAMAAVVAATILTGRPSSGVRVLSLGVTSVILLDPLIVHSVGFRLSVAATAGIVVLARRLAGVLPLPRRIGLAFAVPVAAQIGVAPIAILTFGPPSLLAIPANVLAAPAAAFIMMWGCTFGVVAGLVPGALAALIQWPDRLALEWVTWVATSAADRRTIPLAATGLVVLVAALGFRLLRQRGERWLVVSFVAVLAVPLVAFATSVMSATEVGCFDMARARVCRSSGSDQSVVVAVGGNVDVAALLSSLRSHRIDHVDLLIRTSSSPSAAVVADQVSQRVDSRRTISAAEAVVGGPTTQRTLWIGSIEVTLRGSGEHQQVTLESRTGRAN